MGRHTLGVLPRALAVVMVFLGSIPACSPGGVPAAQAPDEPTGDWSAREDVCAGDFAACNERCAQSARNYCAVLAVLFMQGDPALMDWRQKHGEPGAFADQSPEVRGKARTAANDACDASYRRACAVLAGEDMPRSKRPAHATTDNAAVVERALTEPGVLQKRAERAKDQAADALRRFPDEDAIQFWTKETDRAAEAALALLSRTDADTDEAKRLVKAAETSAKTAEMIADGLFEKTRQRVAEAERRTKAADQFKEYTANCATNPAECRSACEMGDATVCAALGVDYAFGRGVAADAKKADELLRRACGQGADIGCTTLQGLQDTIQKCDEESCEKWCRRGFADGCFRLGALHNDWGGGTRKELAAAFRAFDKACKLGSANGCNEVGYSYYKGVGVRQSVATALRYFNSACNAGNRNACDGVFGAKCYLKAKRRAELDRRCPGQLHGYVGAVRSDEDECMSSMAAARCSIAPFLVEERNAYCCP